MNCMNEWAPLLLIFCVIYLNSISAAIPLDASWLRLRTFDIIIFLPCCDLCVRPVAGLSKTHLYWHGRRWRRRRCYLSDLTRSICVNEMLDVGNCIYLWFICNIVSHIFLLYLSACTLAHSWIEVKQPHEIISQARNFRYEKWAHLLSHLSV